MLPVLSGTAVPRDFRYFRSSSAVYQKYLERGGLRTIKRLDDYGWIKDLSLFQIAKFERTQTPPDLELLRANGFRHGLILWIPAHQDTISLPWREMWIPGSHFTTTGYAQLQKDYFTKWNERAKRARKKYLSSGVVIREVDEDTFCEAFKNTKVRHPFRSDYIKYYRSMRASGPDSIRSFLAYQWDIPLAGLAVHDFDTTSVHLVAFTSEAAKPLQAGTGLIDHWFATSYEIGHTYIHFDHLRDAHMTRDQKGYSEFKHGFLDAEVHYPKIYFQFA